MSASWLSGWLKKIAPSRRHTGKRVEHRLRRFRPMFDLLENRTLLSSTNLQLTNGWDPIYSFTNVGFQENVVANVAVSVNGQADPHKGDFEATIQWEIGRAHV